MALACYNLALIKNPQHADIYKCLAGLLSVVMVLRISMHALRWIFARRQFGIELVHRLQALRRGYVWLGNGNGEEGLLPDRLQNPHRYHNKNLTNFSAALQLPTEE